MSAQRTLIDEFLSCRRIAVVGVSRNPKDFTRALWNAFRPTGGVPVHPSQSDVDGVRCFPDLRSVDPRPDAALILVSRDQVRTVLRECREAGISLVWIYGVTGPKSLPRETIRLCEEWNLRVIAGYCPFMFLPHASWPHRFHGALAKVIGHYPR